MMTYDDIDDGICITYHQYYLTYKISHLVILERGASKEDEWCAPCCTPVLCRRYEDGVFSGVMASIHSVIGNRPLRSL